jgi:Xaa-Pro aminopeptidase
VTDPSNGALLTTERGLERVQSKLREVGLDAWLLYEFRGQNWISAQLLGVDHTTRRSFVLVPAHGAPQALVHAIEGAAWRHWRHPVRRYASWEELERELAALLEGVGRVAMETSPGDAVPTVDLVPAGVVEMVREAGVEPVTSGDLVSHFFSAWSDDQLVEHRRAAEVVAHVARDAFRRAADAIREGSPTTEGGLSEWIRDELARRGVTVDVDTHVAVGSRAADPHYAPDGDGETIERGELLLIDLWGRTSEEAVSADQTWMGMMDSHVPERVAEIWDIVRRARDAAVTFLEQRHASGSEVRGYEVDDVSRRVIEEAGYGHYFIHRTGHSIDTRLHGSGPNLDNLESRDERLLVPGVGFSVEPGIYVPDEIGMRTEINVHYGPDGPEVTPREIQDQVLVLLDD